MEYKSDWEYWEDEFVRRAIVWDRRIARAMGEAAARGTVTFFVRVGRQNTEASRQVLSEEITPEQYQTILETIDAHPSWTNGQIADSLLETTFAALLEEKRAEYGAPAD